MDEIIRRQNANAFDSDNVRVALLNVALMATSFAVPYLLSTLYVLPSLPRSQPTPHGEANITINASLLLRSWLLSSSSSYSTYSTYTLYLIRGFLTLNLLLALHPLFRPTDACEDIPLTPAQRQLLGLPPMSRPATPQEQQQYVTPPRYSRSATPTGSSSSASSLRAAAAPLTSGSPLSGRGSASGSPSMFATVGGRESQIINSGGERRRLSYNSTGRSSPLSLSEFESAGSIGTPTKSGKASVALNSKWLYEKGRGSPRASPRASGSSFA